MSQTGRAAKSLFPAVGVAAAGVTASAAGLWAWRNRRGDSRGKECDKDGAATAATAMPAVPTVPAMPARTGPMVAVYLDEASVEKLHREYPGTSLGRLRKVVIQYGPSDEQRSLYDGQFGGLATVKLTGEASTATRRALTASVSHAGSSVEPQSLSCAVDVTPGDFGGGPLGSAVLIEQIKRAGAAKEESWKGTLSPLTAHEREFPSEEGEYDRLDEPLTVTGSICRADWIEGTSGRCRTHTETGEKRTDGWTPQGCILCNLLEASPCRNVYKRFDSISQRIAELQPPKDPSDENPSETASQDDARGGVVDTPGSGVDEESTVAEGDNDGRSSAGVSRKDAPGAVVGSAAVDEQGVTTAEAGGKGAEELEGEEQKIRGEELEKLEAERGGIAMEMLDCTNFHGVWQDSNADDGITSDMLDDDDEGEDDHSGEDSGDSGVSSGAVEEDVEVDGTTGGSSDAK